LVVLPNRGCVITFASDWTTEDKTVIRTILISLALSLVLTIVLETAFFLLAGKRDRKDLLLLMLVNIITNPIVVLLHWIAVAYTNWNIVFVIVLLELFAILTEGYYYKKHGRDLHHPYLFSTAANMFSFSTGVVIQMLTKG